MNRQQALAIGQALPGKRGIDIPVDVYDRMMTTAMGVTMPLWGRRPTPHQMQALYDAGMTEPEQIHAAFNDLPHPRAPSLKVGEYGHWKDAQQAWTKHTQK